MVAVLAAVTLSVANTADAPRAQPRLRRRGTPYYRSSEEDRDAANELFGQVPEIQWSVPALPSPPTASGLHWQHCGPDNTAFVPDICSPDGSAVRCFLTADGARAAKRQRNR